MNYEKQPAKTEIFEEWITPHINWQKLVDDFLPIWERIVIDKDEKGNITVKYYARGAK